MFGPLLDETSVSGEEAGAEDGFVSDDDVSHAGSDHERHAEAGSATGATAGQDRGPPAKRQRRGDLD